jgi:ATP adenylyltransferase
MADLERLWAPWRSTFLAKGPQRRCFLCAAVKAPRSRDRANHVVARGRSVFGILNLYPYNNGHLMIAPRRHVGRFEQLQPAEWSEMLTVSQRLMRRLTRSLHPQGYNLGFNLGRTAGAGVPGHLHLHIVPRWNGDTNFMPVLGRTKVISQSLDALHRLLTGGQE